MQYYRTISKTLRKQDQIFVSQDVHGGYGGRAFDKPGSATSLDSYLRASSLEELGGTSPDELIDHLVELAKNNRVTLYNTSCFGGSMLVRYLQRLKEDVTLKPVQRKLCIATESIQGMTMNKREHVRFRDLEFDIRGQSMTEIFKRRENLRYYSGGSEFLVSSAPFIPGLLSGATMEVLSKHQSMRSPWEGREYPMSSRHFDKDGEIKHTGAFQISPTTKDEWCKTQLSLPYYGAMSLLEPLFHSLVEEDSDPKYQYTSETSYRSEAHDASVRSLELPEDSITEDERERRRACDEFRF